MSFERIRIKDIAARAGISVGTVDRVLHGRPNVSKKSREKIEKALKEMNYEPNAYASALAYNRSYTFVCIIPKHESEAYWDEVEEGLQAATLNRRDFRITLHIVHYERFNADSFVASTKECLDTKPDGVIVVPAKLELSKAFAYQLHVKNIPFILLDSYLPDLRPLAFFGQDSFQSGYFAARMLMLLASKEEEIFVMKQLKDGHIGSKQQSNRETGFRHYMKDHYPQIRITEVNLPLDGNLQEHNDILETFFTAHPHVHHGITFNSKAYLVGQFLLRTNRRNVQIMGYDMVNKNADCVRQGSISFLIAQHAYLQGYSCVETLFRAIILRREVTAVNYMPIELLTQENIGFYRRTNIG